MRFKPNKWIAAALGIFAQFLALLYVGRPGWAAAYLAAGFIGAIAPFFADGEWAPYGGLLTLSVSALCAIHGFRVARAYDDAHPRRWYSKWYGMAGVCAGIFSLAFCVRSFLLEPFRVPSAAMAPTIEQGTHVIAKKWGYGNYGTFGVHLMKTQVSVPVLRGEIIVFEYPVDRSLHYVKRVVGLPGDRITYYNKRLKINDQEVPTSPAGEYLVKGRGITALRYVERIGEIEYHVILDPAADPYPPFTQAFPFWERCSNSVEGIACTVPELHFFVLGDYRDNSSDSRVWGFVPGANLVGKVQHIVQ